MQSEEGHTNRDLKHTRTAMSTSGGNKKYFFIILVFCEHIFYLLKLLVFIFGKNPCTRRLFLNEKTDVSCLNQCSARFEYCVEREQLTAQMSPSASQMSPVSFTSDSRVRFLSCVISLIVLTTFSSPSSVVFLVFPFLVFPLFGESSFGSPPPKS